MGLLGSLLSPFPVVLLDGLAKTNNKGRKGRKKKQEARLFCCLFGCCFVFGSWKTDCNDGIQCFRLQIQRVGMVGLMFVGENTRNVCPIASFASSSDVSSSKARKQKKSKQASKTSTSNSKKKRVGQSKVIRVVLRYRAMTFVVPMTWTRQIRVVPGNEEHCTCTKKIGRLSAHCQLGIICRKPAQNTHEQQQKH